MTSGSQPRGANTLAGVLDAAERQGYSTNFWPATDGTVRCDRCNASVAAAELRIDHAERLEGVSDPADMMLVVAGQCPACDALGVLVLGFGPNAEAADVAVLPDLHLDHAPPLVV